MLLAVLQGRNAHSFFEYADKMRIAGKTHAVADFPDAVVRC